MQGPVTGRSMPATSFATFSIFIVRQTPLPRQKTRFSIQYVDVFPFLHKIDRFLIVFRGFQAKKRQEMAVLGENDGPDRGAFQGKFSTSREIMNIIMMMRMPVHRHPL
jgi:hypothetical protein